MGQTTEDFSTALYVARQPILDVTGRVFGYELLYRGAPGDTACLIEGELATARVITSALLDLGLGTLTEGRPAFLNVTGALVLDRIESLLPRDTVVLELLETAAVTPTLIAACRNLVARGHRLALDDFTPGSDAEALLPMASFVKVDLLSTPPDVATALAERLKPSGVVMLAEKVETREAYEWTRAAGFELFQGYFFCRPIIQSGAAIPAQQVVYARLLAALNDPDLGAGELEALVKQDVSLALRVLRYANSAAVPNRTEVGTIRQALLLIGFAPIRKWASIWCIAGLSSHALPELSTMALVRARTCELIAERLRSHDASAFFLVGLCSLLDVMLSRSMTDTLRELSLSTPVADALLGRPNLERAVLDAVVAYESGAWDEAMAAARSAGVDASVLPEAYASALAWAQDVRRGGLAA